MVVDDEPPSGLSDMQILKEVSYMTDQNPPEDKPIDISIPRARKARRERQQSGEEPKKPRQVWDMDYRRAKVMELRKLGYRTGDQLAEQLKKRYKIEVHPDTCRNDLVVIDAQLRASAQRDREVEKARQLENVRDMLAVVLPKAVRGDNWSIDRAVNLLKLEAALLGTEAPKEVRFNPVDIARKVAEEEGLSEAEVVAIAEDILRQAKEASL